MEKENGGTAAKDPLTAPIAFKAAGRFLYCGWFTLWTEMDRRLSVVRHRLEIPVCSAYRAFPVPLSGVCVLLIVPLPQKDSNCLSASMADGLVERLCDY